MGVINEFFKFHEILNFQRINLVRTDGFAKFLGPWSGSSIHIGDRADLGMP
jgi:hypothetical protein